MSLNYLLSAIVPRCPAENDPSLSVDSAIQHVHELCATEFGADELGAREIPPAATLRRLPIPPGAARPHTLAG